jgi:PAS domain S-box-containing protein
MKAEKIFDLNMEKEIEHQTIPDPLAKFNSLIHILKGHEEFRLDTNGFIISSNLEAVNITGYEEWEILGKHIDIFYAEDEKGKVLDDLEKAGRLNLCVISGLRMKRKGIPFWAKMKILTLRDEGNTLIGYKVILQDATHRALSNARVRNLKDEYLAIFNNPFVGSFKLRMSDYRIQICNQKTIDIIGRNDSKGLYFSDFFNSSFQFEQFISLLKSDNRVDGFKFLVKDGKSVENWAVISARYFAGTGFVEGVLFDISEQHSQMLELERVNSELDNFTYHASHDLRSPLTSIMGLINLSKLEPKETVMNYLELIEERVKHLDLVLKDLAAVTYNKGGAIESNKFDFKDEIDMLIKKNPITQSNLAIKIDIEQNCNYYTDSSRLRTILWNLILNAFNYNRSDLNRHTVTIKIKVSPTYASINLHDNGMGVEWSLKDKIFDIFFKATSKPTGTGLGLYIVKSMVDKLKGTISFESTVERGTTFLLAIPNSVNDKRETF